MPTPRPRTLAEKKNHRVAVQERAPRAQRSQVEETEDGGSQRLMEQEGPLAQRREQGKESIDHRRGREPSNEAAGAGWNRGCFSCGCLG